jgi:hypothetical protein
MIGYKLFRLRKDGSLGPLFINRRQRLEVGKKYKAEEHPTKSFAFRPGWHVCSEQNAPHLSTKGRVWAKVEISNYKKHSRPANQGGLWYTAKYMRILKVL